MKWIKYSMLFHPLKLHSIDQSFKKLYKELHIIWDEYDVLCNERKRLLLVEIEVASLLMHDVLPSNYSKKGIWGRWWEPRPIISIFQGWKCWFGLQEMDWFIRFYYKSFKNIYKNLISLTTSVYICSNLSFLTKFWNISLKGTIEISWHTWHYKTFFRRT